MTYEDWVRKELRELSKSLGFHYTPHVEIKNRLARIRTRMENQEVEALLVVQKMNFYYLFRDHPGWPHLYPLGRATAPYD